MPGSLVLSSDHAIQNAPYGKWAPIPNPRASLYGLYLLGNDYQPTGSTPLKDWSGNGRDAVMGAGNLGQFGAKSLIVAGGAGPFLTLPFTGDQLTAANGECTILAIAKVSAAVTHRLVENTQGGNTRALALSAASANYDTQMVVTDGTTNRQATSPYDAGRAARFAIYGASVTLQGIQSFEFYGSTVIYPPGASQAFAGIGGTTQLNIGKQSYGTPGGCEIAAVAIFDRALSYAELFSSSAEDGVCTGLQDLMVYEGVTL